jgi:hypothetical protein
MKHNLLAGSIKAALMADTIAAAVANNSRVAGIAHHSSALADSPGDRRIHLLPEVQDAVREANLVIPRKNARRDLARILASDLERELGIALGLALGAELTDPAAQLAGHTFELVTIEGEEGESYLLDGRRIMWVGPVTTKDDGEQVTVHQPIRRITAATEAP